MPKLSNTDLRQFEQRLRAQGATLRAHIQTVLRESEQDEFVQLAGRVHDRGEEAAADLLASASVAIISREVAELAEVEDALKRIRTASYGECEVCGDDIERERLDANPSARRCIDCARDQEARDAGGRDPTPSL